ncbi:hypothetical protein [Pseudonocardia endophytica]|uniref:DoxX-like protein n=1 Tax=Pseudonocardia endophytica TaxID=401976 RepID=A0A4R1HV69_PSEEN|nr:hypothetical protein [Pseudonocardia endophytica]TCK26637.1 hypothetical protein EV378_2478 [Pseudonocardia endophytica]
MAHAVLRAALLVSVLAYGWGKVFLGQMGRVDYADALLTVGEKSPMGLLWTFMAYSPAVQVLAGITELLAGVLLIWRRTAWIGGVLGSVALGVVFLLNMTFDVPVKQLSLALAVGFALVALPESGRLARFASGRPTSGYSEPMPIPWPRVHRVTRWVVASLALVVFAGAGVALGTLQQPPARSASPLPGVYRVTADATPAAPRLSQDGRWQEVAFGQWEGDGTARFTLRQANGDLSEGRYRPMGERVRIDLYPVLAGDRTFVGRRYARSVTLVWALGPDGTLTLSGDGLRLTAVGDPELRYLFDRGFSWGPTPPINR